MRFRSKRVQVIKESLRSGWLAICLAGLLVLPGCASYHVTIPDSDPIRSEGQTAEYQSKTMHAFFWGLLLQPQVLSAECQGQGINDVVVFRTWLHDYVGVITLGIWMPTQVRFRCKAPPTRPGILPGARKRSRGIT